MAVEPLSRNGKTMGDHDDDAIVVTPLTPPTIVKRDGRTVSFDIQRIENALHRCFASFDRTPETPVNEQYWWAINEPDGTPRPALTKFKEARASGVLP